MIPTHIRHRVIAVSMLMAFILYLDRVCLAEIVKSASFNADLGLSKAEIGRALGAFFFTYALFQVPAGWLSDRYGARVMLTVYICLWSLATALTGLVTSFAGILVARLLCGAAEAGAYPTSGAVIRRWIPLAGRARASALVSMGGQAGGTLAPFITAWMVVSLGHWRPVLWIDGAVGLVIAACYYNVVRNRPTEHPSCNAAERALIGEPPAEPRFSKVEVRTLLRSACCNRNLWLIALMQFLIGTGWTYLITWLPTYLKEQKHVEDLAGGRMVTLVLACGVLGQVFGGFFTDLSTRRLGLRWSRSLLLSVAGALGGVAYAGCLYFESARGIIACCTVVSFAVGAGNPAIWALFQDVGGRVTAAVFGWGNMCANLGAASISLLVPWVVSMGSTPVEGQRHVFMLCAGALFLSGVVALGVNAAKPLLPDRTI